MDKSLIDKLLRINEEEASFLPSLEADVMRSSTIAAKRVNKWENDISMRIHARYSPFPTHGHDFVEMMTVVSGSITHHLAGREVKLEVGDILLLNKHITHSIDETGDDDIGINIIISDEFLGAVAPDLVDTVFHSFVKENSSPDGEGAFLHFSTSGSAQIGNLLENLMYELTDEHFDHTVITETVSLLLRYLSLGREVLLRDGIDSLDRQTRRRGEISAYISGNYRSATLGELAEKLYLTPEYLSSLITRLYSVSFKELLIKERLRRAEELLSKTDMPVGTVIVAVGYDNESYFHKLFRSRYGMTPRAYRAKMQGSGVV